MVSGRPGPAGMRARLPAEHREILEAAQLIYQAPSRWVQTLPEPKDAATVLWHLSRIPARERMTKFAFNHAVPPQNIEAMILDVVASGRWSTEHAKLLRTACRGFCNCESIYSAKEAETVLNWYARAEEFGERLLEALRAYNEVFFSEEEKRIRPALEEGLTQAREMARTMPLADLIETLTQGISLPHLVEKPIQLVAAPSFWSTPLIQYFQWMSRANCLSLARVPKTCP